MEFSLDITRKIHSVRKMGSRQLNFSPKDQHIWELIFDLLCLYLAFDICPLLFTSSQAYFSRF
jgi:hypothetical protein